MDDPWRILSDLATDGTMTGLFCAAKATGVLAGAGLVALAMKRRAAATRHLVWVLGLAGALAVLPLALALPRWGVAVLEPPARPEPATASSPVIGTGIHRGAGGDGNADRIRRRSGLFRRPYRASCRTSTEAPSVAWPLVIWCAGTLVVLAWGVTGWASTWWMGRRAQRVTDPIWVEAAREAVERLGTRTRRDACSGEVRRPCR